MLACLSRPLAWVCTASTAAVPASATSTAAASEVTAVRFRRAHRRARRDNGSRQAVTGSSAIHRSTSSASARHVAYRSSGFERHRLEADRLQRRVDRRVKRSGRHEVAPLHLAEHLADIITLERRPAGEQAVERRAQAVDVRPRAQPVQFAARLLRAHVGRRAQRAARKRLGRPARRGRDERPLAALLARLDPAQRLGQAPVHHQRLAVLADDDVARLDVPVQDAAAVGVVDGVADVGEPSRSSLRSASERPAGSLVRVASPWNRSIASLRLSPLMNRIA